MKSFMPINLETDKTYTSRTMQKFPKLNYKNKTGIKH